MNAQLTLLFLTALVGIVYGYSWNDHISTYGLTFSSAVEHDKRRAIFNSNMDEIQAHNQLAAKGHRSYTMGPNRFSHLTHAEVIASYTGYTSSQDLPESPEMAIYQATSTTNTTNTTTTTKTTTTTTTKTTTTTTTTTTTPTNSSSVDWRNTVLVGPIKDQGACG